jgi:tripartite-type tricarboxylate transporter receptor subunit TctC
MSLPSNRVRVRVTAALAAVLACAALVGCSSLTTSTQSSTGDINRMTLIVPADPGGGWDQTARAMQRVLEEEKALSTVQVVNIGGAGGTVGLAKLANERDPNTLMVMGYVMVGAVETNMAENTLADTVPIARLTQESEIIVVPAKSPYRTANDLLDAAKSKGKGISVAGGSAGGADHILAGLMYQAKGIAPKKLNYIPFAGGGESVAALLGGKVSAGISGVGEYVEQIKSGKLRALAVSGAKRTPLLPDVPTLMEQGIKVDLTNWRGAVAPGSVNKAQAERLTTLVTKMHASPQWRAVLKENGWDDAFLTGPKFDRFVDDEVRTVEATLREIGLIR